MRKRMAARLRRAQFAETAPAPPGRLSEGPSHSPSRIAVVISAVTPIAGHGGEACNIHPSPAGHQLLAQAIEDVI